MISIKYPVVLVIHNINFVYFRFTLILGAVWPSIENTPVGNELSKYINIANAILSIFDNRLQYFTGLLLLFLV